MAFKIAHKRKVRAKKFGCWVVRYRIDVSGESMFKKPSGCGKNKIHTVILGVASQSGTGKSFLSEWMKLDSKDGGNRVEQALKQN